MCDSNIYTQQIASTPIAPYEQSRKITCKNMLLHAEQIAPCERDFRVSSHKAIAIIMQLVKRFNNFSMHFKVSLDRGM